VEILGRESLKMSRKMDPKTSGKNGFGTAAKGVHFCVTIPVDIWPMFTR
jgi:hypothetical protein